MSPNSAYFCILYCFTPVLLLFLVIVFVVVILLLLFSICAAFAFKSDAPSRRVLFAIGVFTCLAIVNTHLHNSHTQRVRERGWERE